MIIRIILAVIEFLLSVRFILEFFGANHRTPFVAWVYDYSAPLVHPFANIFANWNLGGFAIDFSTLVALIVYAIAGELILEVLAYI